MSETRQWYDLFSRGARDWLRHNEKIRDAVRRELPDLIAGSDLISRPDNRAVQVPVRFLEHARFRLQDSDTRMGVGQGEGQTGDVLTPVDSGRDGAAKAAGQGEGELSFLLEFKTDDIIDWVWEEFKLPHLKPKLSPAMAGDDWVREGWDRRGARARLDRRRTLKEAVKRRAVEPAGPAFVDEDLRFRQLARRPRPISAAAVFFVLDVSASMEESQRRLAKTFFFWALQGIRRQYARVETVFIAHTVRSWEFGEDEFFQVKGEGGTVASTAFAHALDLLHERFHPSRYNCYLFYASDGDNFTEDHHAAQRALDELVQCLSFMGYVETASDALAHFPDTEMGGLFAGLEYAGHPAASYPLNRADDIWGAIRSFFSERSRAEDGKHG
ncbi:MAG: DUF444 family protein [Betaproteobacteria bacterium]|nr:DUF444 family protein [Betaproteobacteria bacterium]